MSSELDYIRKNIEEVRSRIERAARKSGRSAEDITLVGVTKTVEAERILVAVEEGIKNLGENRVQELGEKYDNIIKGCNWHLIGHLQTNKVKYVIDKVSLIHSLDRLELAEEIQNRAQKHGVVLDVLVQVNVAGESTKFGIAPDSVRDFILSLVSYPNIRVKGLMTIAPYAGDIETVRPVFRKLNEIFIDIKKENIDNIYMEILSMGMSNDFEVAIEEGSNMVRVGTAIFGKRHY